MVISLEKQCVQKFVKWLYRNNKVRCNWNQEEFKSVTEEEMLRLVDNFWNEV